MLGADTSLITPNDMNLPAVIYEMACQAATVCGPGNYYYCLFLLMLGISYSKQSLLYMTIKLISTYDSGEIGAEKNLFSLTGRKNFPFILC